MPATALDQTTSLQITLPKKYFDPRTKLYVTFFILAAIFYSEKYSIIITLTILSLGLMLSEKGTKRKTTLLTVVFLTIFSLLSTTFSYYFLKERNFLRTFVLVETRFLTSFAIITWFFITVSAYEISLILEKLFFPSTLTWMITTAYQFIPLFVQEAKTVNDIRKLRGVTIKKRNPLRMIESLKLILNPLVTSSINRGIELAEAMIIKGFKPRRIKVRLYNLKFRISDLIVIITLTTLGVIAILYSPI